MLMKKVRAFTLAELLITLAVCALLATLLLPAIAHLRPDKKKIMFKKAYSTAERIVYELVNDDDYYPTTGEVVGLANADVIANYLGYSYGGATTALQKSKFCSLFARKVNTIGELVRNSDGIIDVCSENPSNNVKHEPAGNGTYTKPTFVTTDGISWYIPYTDFPSTTTTSEGGTSTTPYDARIAVDVNGEDGPNCWHDQTDCSKPDIFYIHVMGDGKMYVKGELERKYLGTTLLTND